MTTVVDLIRHGEPVGGKKYRGQTDDPLSEKGWQQMRAAVAEHRPWDAIITSPLTRCRAFAEELAQRHTLPLRSDERLKEIAFGEWEGKTAEQIQAANPGSIQRFFLDPLANRPAGAEPVTDFLARVARAWNDLLSDYAGQHLLVVCHAGVIRMSMAHLLGIPAQRAYRIQVGNAAITRFSIEQHDGQYLPRLLFHDGRL